MQTYWLVTFLLEERTWAPDYLAFIKHVFTKVTHLDPGRELLGLMRQEYKAQKLTEKDVRGSSRQYAILSATEIDKATYEGLCDVPLDTISFIEF